MSLFVFVFALLVLSGASAILTLVFSPFKRKLRMGPRSAKWISRGFICLPLIIALAFTIDAAYPSGSFYREEYRSVMGEELDPSARFQRRTASYPDFRGEYASAALIELSPKEYQRLRQAVLDTATFKPGEPWACEEYEEVRGNLSPEQLKQAYLRIDSADVQRSISFVSGSSEILVMVCNF